MKALVIFTVLIGSIFAAHHAIRHSSFSERGSKKLIEELQKSKYGTTLLKMVMLHSEAQGPVQELTEAIEELINDLNNALEDLEVKFQHRTSQHNADVISLEQQIQDATIDIDRAEDVITNLLLPRRSQLRSRISQVKDNQAENRKNLEEATLVRGQEHDSYEAQVADLNSATESVDEALALLATLTNPSMLQIKKFQNSLKKIEGKINKRGKLAPMVKALISLASNQNFADQDIVRQIVNALNDFRAEIVNSLNDLTASEQEAQKDYEEHVDQLNAEFAEFQRQIVNLNMDLTAVEEKLGEITNFQKQRVEDKKSFQAQLDLENQQYAEETEIYTDLKNEHLRELAVSEQALGVLNAGDFSGIHL